MKRCFQIVCRFLGLTLAASSNGRQPRQRRARPAVEALNDRILPAVLWWQVGPAQQTGGPGAHRLTIMGDNHDNNLVIHDNGTAGLNDVTFQCNGASFMPNVAKITEVVIYTGAGHDSVFYQMAGPVLPGVIRDVGVILGNGSDTFTASVGNVGMNADVQFGVDGGNGNDVLQAIATGTIAKGARLEFAYDGEGGNNNLLAYASNVNVQPGATLQFALYGDNAEAASDTAHLGGHNFLQVFYSGQMDGTLVLDDRCDGGTPGSLGGVVNDDITLSNGSTGTVRGVITAPGYGAVVRGGVGIDWLRFVIHAPKTAHVTNAGIQGDGGLDVAIHTSNVATVGSFLLDQTVP
jgi:hypothetical protein